MTLDAKIDSPIYELLKFKIGEYPNKRVAIQLFIDSDDSPFATLTTNLPDKHLEEGEFFIKDWSENEEVAILCMASGLFKNTGKGVHSGFVSVPIWRFSEE